MPHAADHEQQAQRNEAFFESIGGENAAHPDWAITALFYVAVQRVQALCLRKGWKIPHNGALQYPATHVQRLEIVQQELAAIEVEYRSLKDWSEGARYKCQAFQPGQIKLAKSILDKILAHIDTVK